MSLRCWKTCASRGPGPPRKHRHFSQGPAPCLTPSISHTVDILSPGDLCRRDLLSPIIVCIKCSIITVYYRLFGVRKGIARICYVLMGMTVAWGIATLFPAIFQCKPIHVAWDLTSTRSECFKLRAYFVGTNVPNVLLDFAILVTPLYPLWKLKLPTTKKVLISGVFALGAWYAVTLAYSRYKTVCLPPAARLLLVLSAS